MSLILAWRHISTCLAKCILLVWARFQHGKQVRSTWQPAVAALWGLKCDAETTSGCFWVQRLPS